MTFWTKKCIQQKTKGLNLIVLCFIVLLAVSLETPMEGDRKFCNEPAVPLQLAEKEGSRVIGLTNQAPCQILKEQD